MSKMMTALDWLETYLPGTGSLERSDYTLDDMEDAYNAGAAQAAVVERALWKRAATKWARRCRGGGSLAKAEALEELLAYMEADDERLDATREAMEGE